MPTYKTEDGTIVRVESLESYTSRGEAFHQIQAVDDGVSLSDQSGEAPWVSESELAFD